MICRAKLFRLAWSTARSMSLFNKTSPRREFAYALKRAWKEMKNRIALEAMYARQTAEKVAADRAALLEARARAQPDWDAQDAAAIAKANNGLSCQLNTAAARAERRFGCKMYGGGYGSVKYTACH